MQSPDLPAESLRSALCSVSVRSGAVSSFELVNIILRGAREPLSKRTASHREKSRVYW